MPAGENKSPSRGRGPWTAKGVQAAQQNDIDQLKALVTEMAGRLDAIEAGQEVPPVDENGNEVPPQE
jgi:hypothetical protein